MKKTVALILTIFCLTNFAYSKICFKEPVCLSEPEKGLFVLKIDTKKYSIRPYVIEEGLDTSENVYKNGNFSVVINGGYFDFLNKKTVSFVVKDGVTVLDPLKNENLMNSQALKPNIDLVLNRGELRRLDCGGEIKYEILKHYDTVKPGCRILDSLQAGPILYPELKIEEEYFVAKDKAGEIIRDAIQTYQKKPRTAVGIKRNNVYFIIATKEHPMSLEDLYKFSKHQRFEKVLNLDGGGSTSLTTEIINIKSDKNDTQRKVKSFLVVE